MPKIKYYFRYQALIPRVLEAIIGNVFVYCVILFLDLINGDGKPLVDLAQFKLHNYVIIFCVALLGTIIVNWKSFVGRKLVPKG